MSRVLTLKDFRLNVSVHEMKKSTAIYGGTFDPFHLGHVSIVRELVRMFPRVIIAPSAKNPWKENLPTALSLRIAMIKKVLAYEEMPLKEETPEGKVEIIDFEYFFSEELITHLGLTQDRHVCWAIGEDLAFEVTKWKNWERMHFTAITFPIKVDIRATQIREGHAEPHPAIVEFAKKHNLYRK